MESKRVPELRFEEFSGEWEERKLGEIAESFEYGLNASATSYDGENKYIRITDIDDNSREFIQNDLTSPSTDLNKAEKYLLKNSDILFARTGASVGKTYCYEEKDGRVYYAGFLIRARLKHKFNANFVFQSTLTSQYNNFVKITSQRSGQPGINAQEYANFSIMVPDKGEQDKIGNFFKKLNDTIALHQQELDTLKQTKQGFLQKMFPKDGETIPEIRFPGFSGEWEESKAKELFQPVSKKGYPNLPVLSVTQDSGVVYRNEVGIDIKYDHSTLKNYKVIQPGDFVISLRSFQGGFELSDKSGITSPAYTIFIPKNREKHSDLFWITQFKTFKFIESLKTVTFGIRDGKSISFSEFGDLKLKYPSQNEEQIKIGEFFKQLNNTIALQQKELDALKETKKAFLQKMLI